MCGRVPAAGPPGVASCRERSFHPPGLPTDVPDASDRHAGPASRPGSSRRSRHRGNGRTRTGAARPDGPCLPPSLPAPGHFLDPGHPVWRHTQAQVPRSRPPVWAESLPARPIRTLPPEAGTIPPIAVIPSCPIAVALFSRIAPPLVRRVDEAIPATCAIPCTAPTAGSSARSGCHAAGSVGPFTLSRPPGRAIGFVSQISPPQTEAIGFVSPPLLVTPAAENRHFGRSWVRFANLRELHRPARLPIRQYWVRFTPA